MKKETQSNGTIVLPIFSCADLDTYIIWDFLGWEDPLEKGVATHSSILAWKTL